ncbi:MAG: N-acetyl-alpha-D-glucosaminyl L-malate synthase BshA [Candidatus Hydrogenedentota bacterium]|nr:MAG: N-acetyl-alpha-D-glucosaminyl L-malate synthase BshA [Candidatus Hydrogenedentota bacterium]
MKIGITCHPSAGGSGIMATELGIALAQRGHEIHFVTTGLPFRLTGFHSNIVCHTVDVISYPLFTNPPASLALATKIAEVAEENDIELWHAHYAIPNAACAILGRDMLPEEKKFKIITTLHGTDITLVGADPSFFRITKFAMESSDAVTAVSNWLADETRKEFKLTKPVQMIYNFLDEEKFPPECTPRCTLADDNEKIVMHVSNFRPVKRVTDVVRVFKKISEQVNAILVMVGDGPERMSAVGVARQLGITDRIKYLGRYENIENILPCADLVFQPSEHESFGLTPLEAMACEVPVLGTRSGGITEVVEHGVTGYLAEVGDIDTMAKYALKILTDEEHAKEMGKKGYERAMKLFSKEAIIDQYEAVYHEVMNS